MQNLYMLSLIEICLYAMFLFFFGMVAGYFIALLSRYNHFTKADEAITRDATKFMNFLMVMMQADLERRGVVKVDLSDLDEKAKKDKNAFKQQSGK